MSYTDLLDTPGFLQALKELNAYKSFSNITGSYTITFIIQRAFRISVNIDLRMIAHSKTSSFQILEYAINHKDHHLKTMSVFKIIELALEENKKLGYCNNITQTWF